MNDMLENIDKDLKLNPETESAEPTAESKITDDEVDALENPVEETAKKEVITEEGEKAETIETVVLKQVKDLTDAVAVLTSKLEASEANINTMKAEVAKLFFNPKEDVTVEKDKKITVYDLIDEGVIGYIL